MSQYRSKLGAASAWLGAIAGGLAALKMPMLLPVSPPLILKVAPFTIDGITKLFKVGFLCFFVPQCVLACLFLRFLGKSAFTSTWWGRAGYRARGGTVLCRNGANGTTLRTAVGTSGVKLLLFKLYDARDCQLSHSQHINYVNCSCTFFNPDFSWIMDDRQGQNLLLVFPCEHLYAECTEQS